VRAVRVEREEARHPRQDRESRRIEQAIHVFVVQMQQIGHEPTVWPAHSQISKAVVIVRCSLRNCRHRWRNQEIEIQPLLRFLL